MNMSSKKFNPSAVFSMSTVKKATAQLQSTMTGHSELSMAMYGEKCVVDAVEKVVGVRAEATEAWLKWAEKEDSGPIREMTLKLDELDALWIAVHNDYADTYNINRKLYKQVLKGEQTIDELAKQFEDANNKIKKAQKQVDSAVKSKDKKTPHYNTELSKALTEADTIGRHLETRKMNHAVFKYGKVRDAHKQVMDFQIDLHEKCLEIAKARRAILEMYTGHHYHSMTPDMVLNASVDATKIIIDVSAKVIDENTAGSPQRQGSSGERPPSQVSGDSWSDDAMYHGIPPSGQQGDIVDGSSSQQGDVMDSPGTQQRPLPQLPTAAGAQSPPSIATRRPLPPEPSDELYDYIEPSKLPPPPHQQQQQQQSDYDHLQSEYDNTNVYLTMSQPTSNVDHGLRDQYQPLPPLPPADAFGNIYPRIPDDPEYEMAGGGGLRSLSSISKAPPAHK